MKTLLLHQAKSLVNRITKEKYHQSYNNERIRQNFEFLV